MGAQEKYELSAEQIEKLRQEMERERRTTMAENEYAMRRVQEMERANKEMKQRREKGKAEFDRARAQAEDHNRKQKEFEDALNEISRKSNLN